MTVKELKEKLARFEEASEVLICYDSAFCCAAILDVYIDEHARVLLSEDMERTDKVRL